MGKKDITKECELLTFSAVAELLDCHYTTVNRYCDEGRLPFVDLNKDRTDVAKRSPRIRVVDLQKFISKRTYHPTKYQREILGEL